MTPDGFFAFMIFLTGVGVVGLVLSVIQGDHEITGPCLIYLVLVGMIGWGMAGNSSELKTTYTPIKDFQKATTAHSVTFEYDGLTLTREDDLGVLAAKSIDTIYLESYEDYYGHKSRLLVLTK